MVPFSSVFIASKESMKTHWILQLRRNRLIEGTLALFKKLNQQHQKHVNASSFFFNQEIVYVCTMLLVTQM